MGEVGWVEGEAAALLTSVTSAIHLHMLNANIHINREVVIFSLPCIPTLATAYQEESLGQNCFEFSSAIQNSQIKRISAVRKVRCCLEFTELHNGEGQTEGVDQKKIAGRVPECK